MITAARRARKMRNRSEEHTSELQSRSDLVCRLLLEKKKKIRFSDHPSPQRDSSHAEISYSLASPPQNNQTIQTSTLASCIRAYMPSHLTLSPSSSDYTR